MRDGEPWLPVEVKLTDTALHDSWAKFALVLPCKQGLQVVRQPHWTVHRFADRQILVAGAAEALRYFA